MCDLEFYVGENIEKFADTDELTEKQITGTLP